MKRFERENKLPPYAVATLYISIGCIICTALFLYGSSLSKNSTTVVPALFQPREESASLALADTPTSSTDTPVTDTSASFDAETPYYAFTTLNTKSSLHVRIQPGMDAEIIARLAPNTTGYVIEKGDAWSLISTGDITGYASNQYLQFREIPKEEYPFP